MDVTRRKTNNRCCRTTLTPLPPGIGRGESMAYEIEDIPLENISKSEYTPLFEKMKVGQSFLEPDPNKVNNLKVSSNYYSKKHGVKFVIRKVDGGHRCYRVDVKP